MSWERDNNVCVYTIRQELNRFVFYVVCLDEAIVNLKSHSLSYRLPSFVSIGALISYQKHIRGVTGYPFCMYIGFLLNCIRIPTPSSIDPVQEGQADYMSMIIGRRRGSIWRAAKLEEMVPK